MFWVTSSVFASLKKIHFAISYRRSYISVYGRFLLLKKFLEKTARKERKEEKRKRMRKWERRKT